MTKWVLVNIYIYFSIKRKKLLVAKKNNCLLFLSLADFYVNFLIANYFLFTFFNIKFYILNSFTPFHTSVQRSLKKF